MRRTILKDVLMCLLISSSLFLVMRLMRALIPALDTSVYRFMSCVVPLTVALVSVVYKYSPLVNPQHEETIPWDIDSLLEIDKNSVEAQTVEDHEAFLETHELCDSFITKVVGVTYSNDDGTSRQEILSHCMIGEPVGFYYYTYNGQPAYAVISDHGQIGHLSQKIATDLDQTYGDDDTYISGQISDITGGTDGLYYGCSLMVCIYQRRV